MYMPFPCEVHESDTPIETVFQTVVQAREDLVVKRDNMGTTALMRVYEVMDVKRRIGGKNNKAVLEYYSKVKMAKTSEPVTNSFLDIASMLSSSCLNIPEVVTILMGLDEMEVNPLDSPSEAARNLHSLREETAAADLVLFHASGPMVAH